MQCHYSEPAICYVVWRTEQSVAEKSREKIFKKEQSRVEKQHKKITKNETWQKEVEQDGKDEN